MSDNTFKPDHISCESALEELERVIEARSSLSIPSQKHFETCTVADCRAKWANFRLLEQAIRQWHELPLKHFPKRGLSERVLQQLWDNDPARNDPARNAGDHDPSAVIVAPQFGTADNRQAGSSRTAIAAVLGTLTLCLLMTVGAIAPNWPGRGHSFELLTEQQVPTAPATLITAEEQELRELGRVYGRIVQVTAERLTDTMSLVRLEDQPPQPEERSLWFTDWSETIGPLQLDLDGTLRQLFDSSSTPGDDQTQRPLPPASGSLLNDFLS